jgi:hypothetical protein
LEVSIPNLAFDLTPTMLISGGHILVGEFFFLPGCPPSSHEPHSIFVYCSKSDPSLLVHFLGIH